MLQEWGVAGPVPKAASDGRLVKVVVVRCWVSPLAQPNLRVATIIPFLSSSVELFMLAPALIAMRRGVVRGRRRYGVVMLVLVMFGDHVAIVQIGRRSIGQYRIRRWREEVAFMHVTQVA